MVGSTDSLSSAGRQILHGNHPAMQRSRGGYCEHSAFFRVEGLRAVGQLAEGLLHYQSVSGLVRERRGASP